MWDDFLPWRHTATPHTHVDDMYLSAHWCFLDAMRHFSSAASEDLLASVGGSLRCLDRDLQSSFHHLALKPGANPHLRMVSLQAALIVTYRRSICLSMSSFDTKGGHG